jgi:hypothetical protein
MDEAQVLKHKGNFRWRNLMVVTQHVWFWFKFVLQHLVFPLQLQMYVLVQIFRRHVRTGQLRISH